MCRGVLEVLLDVDVAVAERRFGLALRQSGAACGKLRRVRDDPHAAAAAARRGLDDDRESRSPWRRLSAFVLALDRAVAARQHRHAGLLHRPARARLVAHQPDDARVGPMNLMLHASQTSARYGALGQEAVAGMNRVGAGDLGGADDRRDVEIAVGAARRADADVLVGEAHVQRVLVGLGVDGDGLDARARGTRR